MSDVAALTPSLRTAQLYASLAASVRRALAGLGIAASDVDDLTQDVFITLHRRGLAFANERAARAWLYGAARRVASNHRRAQRRRQLRLEHAPVPTAMPNPEEVVERRRATAKLDRFASALPGDARAVFQMSHLQGLSGPTISERLGLPLNTTYSHIRRTRSRLRTIGLFALVLAMLAVSLFSATCASEVGNDRSRIALRGDSDAAG